MKSIKLFFFMLLIASATFAQTSTKPKTTTTAKPATAVKGRLVQVTTDYGIMVIRLYD